jgi:UDP-N-acetylmuramyl pentapeptide phosphotransferase/UDP-N-acetylglucosamine-1-phosphate transferase
VNSLSSSPPQGPVLLVIVAAALVSAILTFAALIYARRRSLLDLPGRRRSHVAATPRGGGIAIVLVVVASCLWLSGLPHVTSPLALAFGAGLMLVAAISWIDDHRSLPALVRLAVHTLAAALFVMVLPAPSGVESGPGQATIFALRLLTLVTAINFWNFMDGIDGLVATQSAWVTFCAMLLLSAGGVWIWALLAAIMVAACLGFLPFNFPRARIFLGDVGSGGLGFACGALLLVVASVGAASIWVLLIVASALWIDAGMTLASRMFRGRRWYRAHREHLYQWMVRSGRSHATTTYLYLAWNVILVFPLVWLSHSNPRLAPLVCSGAIALGVVAWCLGKRGALARVGGGGLR